MINKTLRDKITAQAINEIEFARTYKSGKIKNWQKNEEMYYGKKIASIDSRANVSLGRMQGFVHTLLSKIDNPLIFKFEKRKDAQLKRVELLNGLRRIDANNDNWDIKDLVGKKQSIIYGRAIYKYYASSDVKYKANLEPIDVYDFLIDPSCGGVDVEQASYLGYYNIVKSRKELKDGVKKGIYNRDNVNQLIEGAGNSDETSIEESNKRSRSYGQGTTSNQKEIKSNDKFKFWEWFTTFEGTRYYILMTNNGLNIRIEELDEMTASGMWPIWTWACFPDLTEFWTPSYCDYVREIFMAQDVSINQMLDNAEAINKPMKIVNVEAIEDLAKLKYRRDGIIPTKGNFDANRAVQVINTPSINTPLQVFKELDAIAQAESGVTDGGMGVSDEDGKVGIYEGNQAATADRFGLLNKSYAFGYKRFAKLYEWGVKEHLIKKVAVEIVGPKGVEIQAVSRKDMFRKGDDFGVLVEASNAELNTNIQEKRMKMTFLSNNGQNPIQNPKKAYEMGASIIGFNEDDIKQLTDIQFYGNKELMSEADRDIEDLLAGEEVKPNKNANNAYRQKILDFMKDHEEDIDMKQFMQFTNYFQSLEPIVMANEARNLANEGVNMVNQQTEQITNTPIEEPINNGKESYEI